MHNFYAYMQAFIHPFLARIFWSTPIITGDILNDTIRTPSESSWSPYGYCNGTYVLDHNRHFVSLEPRESNIFFDLTFIDFAGSGLVHVCGKL